jgi:hypothetical protein
MGYFKNRDLNNKTHGSFVKNPKPQRSVSIGSGILILEAASLFPTS